MERKVDGVTVQVVRGNIAAQPDLDAIVNAANAQLRAGGGVAGAIHRAAGPGMEAECRPLAPIRPGEAVITGGHRLPNRFVVHTLGPIHGRDRPEAELLANCYVNSLRAADGAGARSIGFPAISTGVFGYPVGEAAEVAFGAIRRTLPSLNNVRTVRMVLFGEDDLRIHEEAFQRTFGDM